MALNKKPVNGMKDILPEEMQIRDYVMGVIKENYRKFGFTPIETPCVESIGNLCSKQGGENEKLIFKILKRGEKLNLETAKEEKAVKEPARRKKNTPGDYRETYFMRVDLTDRQPLYVSRTTHEKLMKIVTVIGGRKATVSSYVENILLRHFDQFQDEINELYESKFEKPF